jgi:hypothetical protein
MSGRDLGRRYEAKEGEKRCKEEGEMSSRGFRKEV